MVSACCARRLQHVTGDPTRRVPPPKSWNYAQCDLYHRRHRVIASFGPQRSAEYVVGRASSKSVVPKGPSQTPLRVPTSPSLSNAAPPDRACPASRSTSRRPEPAEASHTAWIVTASLADRARCRVGIERRRCSPRPGRRIEVLELPRPQNCIYVCRKYTRQVALVSGSMRSVSLKPRWPWCQWTKRGTERVNWAWGGDGHEFKNVRPT